MTVEGRGRVPHDLSTTQARRFSSSCLSSARHRLTPVTPASLIAQPLRGLVSQETSGNVIKRNYLFVAANYL